MSCIVYQTDKRTGIKYAYSSESYWDKEKQQPRSRRKYIGKVDPETGEIIRKGEERKGKPGPGEELPEHVVTLREQNAALIQQAREQEARIRQLERQNEQMRKALRSVEASLLSAKPLYSEES